VARTALWVSLAAQVAGSAAATAMAGRIRWFTVFLVTTAAYLAVFERYALGGPRARDGGCLPEPNEC